MIAAHGTGGLTGVPALKAALRERRQLEVYLRRINVSGTPLG